MLIFRYLAKEVFMTLVALTTILLLIFMSNQFVQYLNRAVNGQFPVMFVMKLMMLELPNLMVLLLPLGFYVSLIVAYGRLYADSEMTVLNACGYGTAQLLKHSLIMAFVVMIVVTCLVLWGGPYIAIERAKLIKSEGIQTLIKTVSAGRFNALHGGRQVFYIETMNRDHTEGKQVFLAQLKEKKATKKWNVLWAEDAFVKTDPTTFESYIILENGRNYEGFPGQADYQVAEFERFKARLPHPVMAFKEDIRTASTGSLWPLSESEPVKSAELEWRISIPLMVLALTLVAVPLSRVNPRSGKFAKLMPAILLYIVYANFMFVTRNWITVGKIPVWLGMWWMPILVASIGLILMWRQRVN